MACTVQHEDYGRTDADWGTAWLLQLRSQDLSAIAAQAPPVLLSVVCSLLLIVLFHPLPSWGCAGISRSLCTGRGWTLPQGSRGAAHFFGRSRWKGSRTAWSHASSCLLSQDRGKGKANRKTIPCKSLKSFKNVCFAGSKLDLVWASWGLFQQYLNTNITAVINSVQARHSFSPVFPFWAVANS